MSDAATTSTLPHVVIIGGGFGGLAAAKHLRKAPVRVTVIDRHNYHLFQPLLYQVATAGLSPANIAAPIRSILRKSENTEVVMGEVIGIDKTGKEVILIDRRFKYDYLIIATGARHSYFGKDEWGKHAPGLKTIADATSIREKILLAFEAAEIEPVEKERQELLNFVVVGGGPTGVEMAGSIAELAHKALAADFRHIDPTCARIILIEAGPRLLAAFPEDLSAEATSALYRLGVEVRTNARVEDVRDNGVLVNGEFIKAHTVIWAAGVVASPAGKWLGAETDRAGRVKVGPNLNVPGHAEIFVIGDTAAITDRAGKNLPGVAPVAMQTGRYVASVIKKTIKGQREPKPFKYLDKGNMATIGRSSAIADVRNIHLSGFIAWLAWLAVHILYIIGFRNRVLVLIQWAWAYVTYSRGARLITDDEQARGEIYRLVHGQAPGKLVAHDGRH